MQSCSITDLLGKKTKTVPVEYLLGYYHLGMSYHPFFPFGAVHDVELYGKYFSLHAILEVQTSRRHGHGLYILKVEDQPVAVLQLAGYVYEDHQEVWVIKPKTILRAFRKVVKEFIEKYPYTPEQQRFIKNESKLFKTMINQKVTNPDTISSDYLNWHGYPQQYLIS